MIAKERNCTSKEKYWFIFLHGEYDSKTVWNYTRYFQEAGYSTLLYYSPTHKSNILNYMRSRHIASKKKEHYSTNCFNRDIDLILWSHIGLFWDYWHFVQPSRQQVGWAESLKELLIVWRHTKPPPPLRFIFNKTYMGP